MIRLGLLRHGHTAWNRAGRLQGRTDVPLDAAARAGLAALALPPGWAGAAVLASPLARAAETAALLTGRPAVTDARLIEMDWGAFEGRHGAALAADPASGFREPEAWGWDWSPPGGESPAGLRARLAPFLAGLTRDTVAVTHAGVIRVVLALAHAWAFAGPAPFAIRRACVHGVAFPAGDPSAMLPLPGPDRLVPRGAGCVR